MPVPVFTTGEVLTAANMNAVGLWRVTGCTVTSVGGTAATASNGVITIGAGNTSITVNNAFSSNFVNYKIMISGGVTNVDAALGIQLGASVTGYYGSLVYSAHNSTTAQAAPNSNASTWIYGGIGTANNLSMNCDLFSPFEAKTTGIMSLYAQHAVNQNAGTFNGFHNSATSYSSFTVIVNGGNATGGTIRVYGYNK